MAAAAAKGLLGQKKNGDVVRRGGEGVLSLVVKEG